MLYALNLHWAVSQENGKKDKSNEKKESLKRKFVGGVRNNETFHSEAV